MLQLYVIHIILKYFCYPSYSCGHMVSRGDISILLIGRLTALAQIVSTFGNEAVRNAAKACGMSYVKFILYIYKEHC